MARPKPVMLLILDGWGSRPPSPDNAISEARTPHWDALLRDRHPSELITHGMAVGLPEGQMGNSEVGHMNIGAGRIVYQDFTRISKSIADGEFNDNPALNQAMAHAKRTGGTLHIMGLLSPGGVHSHESHFLATLDLALTHEVPQIALHCFTDGRDVAPRSALASFAKLDAYTENPHIRLATVAGRYFAMDRDRRWDRTQLAWQMINRGEAPFHAQSGADAVEQAYARGEDDEFIQPTAIGQSRPMTADDVGIFINFRSDRARQLSQALIDPNFSHFDRGDSQPLSELVTMTEYSDQLPCEVAFPAQSMAHVLGEVVSAAGMTQLRIAETEKYAHVTYFFNGGHETPFPGESRILIPSPQVATYDLQPQMSAPELTRALTEAIESGQYDLIVANVANPDMVGHTGDLNAAIAAIEAVDSVIGQVCDSLTRAGGAAIITADHGNAEQMTDPKTGQAHTAHTLNPVPLIYVGPESRSLRPNGTLRDIAPTLLDLLELAPPSDMTGQSLLHVSP